MTFFSECWAATPFDARSSTAFSYHDEWCCACRSRIRTPLFGQLGVFHTEVSRQAVSPSLQFAREVGTSGQPRHLMLLESGCRVEGMIDGVEG